VRPRKQCLRTVSFSDEVIFLIFSFSFHPSFSSAEHQWSSLLFDLPCDRMFSGALALFLSNRICFSFYDGKDVISRCTTHHFSVVVLD
jgi:hypothetical protein